MAVALISYDDADSAAFAATRELPRSAGPVAARGAATPSAAYRHHAARPRGRHRRLGRRLHRVVRRPGGGGGARRGDALPRQPPTAARRRRGRAAAARLRGGRRVAVHDGAPHPRPRRGGAGAAPGAPPGRARADPLAVSRPAPADHAVPLVPGGGPRPRDLSGPGAGALRVRHGRVHRQHRRARRADHGGVAGRVRRRPRPPGPHPAPVDHRRGVRRGAGLAWAAAATATGPVVDHLDLLVLR